MENWEINNRIQDINAQQVIIPNGIVGKPYQFCFNFEQLGWQDLTITGVDGLEDTGLFFNTDAYCISGIPVNNGDHQVMVNYHLEQHQDVRYIRKLTLIINPDPKSLWKDIPGDRHDPYWKEDQVSETSALGRKHLVVASRRGRAHANRGDFRDDDYQYATLPSGWNLVVVADGAGSAKYSREGSKKACEAAVAYFSTEIDQVVFTGLDEMIVRHYQEAEGDRTENINLWIYHNLGSAALYIHKQLGQRAMELQVPLEQLHTTLAFTLFKQYDSGYAVLSFGVGDCSVVLINQDCTSVKVMNKLDVGEYGGGTRFITMPEIFQHDQFATRFNFKMVRDFGYLILMTDGIYDPKFEVEANLEKPERWQAFFKDLEGGNDEGICVVLNRENQVIADQLLQWSGFWSPGNHDDRTLAIIF